MSERMSDEQFLKLASDEEFERTFPEHPLSDPAALQASRLWAALMSEEARRAREAEARLQEIVNSVSVALSGAVPLPGFRGNDLGSLVLSERRRFRSEAEAIRAELRKHIVAADDVPAVQLAEALGACLRHHQQELRDAGVRHAEEIRGYQASLTAAHAERNAERARAEMAEQTRDQLLEENARLRAGEEDGQ